MIKKIVLLGLLAICLSGCLGFHQIHLDGDDHDITCVRFARAGDVVDIHTAVYEDAEMRCYVDDIELAPVSAGYYTFVMPDRPVTIKVVVIGNGLA